LYFCSDFPKGNINETFVFTIHTIGQQGILLTSENNILFEL